MKARYKNREGEVWELDDVRPHPTYRAMALATRRDTGETVTVLARELVPVEGKAESGKAESGN